MAHSVASSSLPSGLVYKMNAYCLCISGWGMKYEPVKKSSWCQGNKVESAAYSARSWRFFVPYVHGRLTKSLAHVLNNQLERLYAYHWLRTNCFLRLQFQWTQVENDIVREKKIDTTVYYLQMSIGVDESVTKESGIGSLRK